jgi:iron complex outermembrane recepter protein
MKVILSSNPKRKMLVSAVATAIAASCYSSVVHAQAALDEIIVTAQKKDDTLQTVPMTVNAVTAETISKYNLLDFKDIQSVTPGLTIKSQDTRTSTIAMRGVNVLTDTGYGPGVAIYWNEVNYDIDSAFTGMYDIGQIEVLRGPQGTLRGITAPAGAVTLVTKQPSFNEIEGTVEQSFGERELTNTQFGMSLPIVENVLALRIAGLYDHNQNDDIKNIVNGKTNSNLTRSGRLTVGLRPTDNLEATLTHQYTETNRSGSGAVRGVGAFGSIDAFDRKSVDDGQSNNFIRNVDTALRVEWNLDGYDLTSITGYRDQTSRSIVNTDPGNLLDSTDADVLGNPLPTAIGDTQPATHTFTQEIRFATADADFYNWTYGVYASRITAHTTNDSVSFIDVGGGALIAPTAAVAIDNKNEEYAVFTNQSFQWTDELETQVGLRYQSKRATTRLEGVAVDPFTGANPVEFPTGGGAAKAVDEGVTGTASVSYQLTDDVRLYSTYGRSFRSGGFTVAPGTPGELTQYEPETSDSIEFGFKSRLLDGRLQANGAIYYQKYHDFLARTSEGIRTVGGPTGQGDDFLNYNANAVVKGAELQLDALLTDDWQAGLGLSYTDAKFKDGRAFCNVRDGNGDLVNPPADANGVGVNYCDANGRLSGEPNWGVTASSEYTLHFDTVDAFARGLYTFSSGRSDDSIEGSVLDTSSYGIWNLYLGVRDQQRVWELTGWVKNLFDHEQVIRYSPASEIAGIQSGYAGVQLVPERQIGITGKYNFSL